MYLISHGDKDSQEIHIQVPIVVKLDIIHWIVREAVCLVGQKRHNHGEIVAVRFDEIVSRYCCRIDVMFAEIS